MLDDYLKELQKITLLEPDEERALWQAYKDNGDMMARSRLIEQYQPLVFKETKVVRLWDESHRTLVYLAISRKLIDGAPANSIATVPVRPWAAP